MARQSKSAKAFMRRIEEVFNIRLVTEFRIGRKYYDAKWRNLLIEIDGKYWHAHPEVILRDRLKEEIAKENGYRLVRIKVNTIEEVPSKFLRYYPVLKEAIQHERTKIPENPS